MVDLFLQAITKITAYHLKYLLTTSGFFNITTLKTFVIARVEVKVVLKYQEQEAKWA